MVYLTRRERFNAAHRLHNKEWSKALSSIIKEHITNKLDHKNLNIEVEFLEDVIPSIENIVIAVWKELAPKLEGCQLHCIKLVETENIYVEYFGS